MSWKMRALFAGAKLYWRIVRPIAIGVRVIMIRDERVLLVKHTYIPGWYFPGGGVKRGETLETAVRREASEEVGASLGVLQLDGVYSGIGLKSDHTAVFRCHEFEMDGTHDTTEIAQCQFFSIYDLPPETSRGSRQRIKAYLNGGKGCGFGEW